MSSPGPDCSCFSRLPLELVYDVLRHAAHDGASSRAAAWTTGLSLVSRAVHAQVVPIVYHTLVVSQRIDKYRALMRNTASQRLLRHVRRLYIYRWLDDHDVRLFADALSGKEIRIIHAPMRLVEQLSLSSGFYPTEIHIEFAPFESIIQLGAPAVERLTHLLAFWPDDPVADGDPCFEVALALPALTHLAIRFADFDWPVVLPVEFDTDGSRHAVLSTLKAVLKHPGIQYLVIELAGAYVHLQQDFEARLQELKDDRIFLCVNNRMEPLSWHKYREVSENEALLGYSIWGQGRAVCPSP